MVASILLKIARQLSSLQSSKIFLPTILGTIVEYYDYALYGFCAVFLAQAFFPTLDPSLALLKTFGIFVAGSLSKPMGALLFGYIGDKLGRSFALKISIMGIAIPTTCIGCMPTYNNIGSWAPFLLLICRILQGIFVSGESDGARIFIFESVGKKYPNFINSLTNLAMMIGYYLASVVAVWVASSNLPDWVWRVPFIMSGIMGVLVFWYRHSISESIEFKKYLDASAAANKMRSSKFSFKSLWMVFAKNRQALLATILLFGAVGGGYHFYFTFFGSYVSKVLNIADTEQITIGTSRAVLIYTLFGPIAGLVADRYGAVLVFKYAAWTLLALTVLNGWMIYIGNFSAWVMLLTASVLPFFHAPGFVILIEKFKIDERYRCISFGHSVGSMLFSGSAPWVGLWIWQISHKPIAPFIYFVCLIMMGYLALCWGNNYSISQGGKATDGLSKDSNT